MKATKLVKGGHHQGQKTQDNAEQLDRQIIANSRQGDKVMNRASYWNEDLGNVGLSYASPPSRSSRNYIEVRLARYIHDLRGKAGGESTDWQLIGM